MTDPPSPGQLLSEIRKLYFETTERSVGRDLSKAIDLFKQLHDDADRARAAVFMDGLSQMRSEWASRTGRGSVRPPKAKRRQ